MFTEMDKALVAVIMGTLSLLTIWWGWDLSYITDEKVLSAIAILMPIIVWLAPNKFKTSAAPLDALSR